MVSVNFAASTQGVLGNSCSPEDLRLKRLKVCSSKVGNLYHSDFFDYKRHSAVLDRIVWYRTWFVRHKSAKGVDRLDPNTRYKRNRISGVDRLDPNT